MCNYALPTTQLLYMCECINTVNINTSYTTQTCRWYNKTVLYLKKFRIYNNIMAVSVLQTLRSVNKKHIVK